MEFEERLQEGKEYEDYVATLMLKKHGIVIQVYTSHKYQKQAESIQNFEIKNDKLHKNTGRLFIEVQEGNRQLLDESIIFIVGDYEDIYIFATKHLKQFMSDKKPNVITTRDNVKGFLLEPKDIERLCISKVKGLQ
jgi:hypothetical protein